MKPSQLIRFRHERKWTKDKMSKRIGISITSLRKYEMQHESKDVPLAIALACASIAWHLKPFGD